MPTSLPPCEREFSAESALSSASSSSEPKPSSTNMVSSRTPPAEQWQNKPTPQTNLRKTKKDAHAPSIKTSNHQTYQAIITKFISNRKEGREEEKKKLKRMKNRCTEEVQEVQALGQLVSVS